jgi:hypothetical protein
MIFACSVALAALLAFCFQFSAFRIVYHALLFVGTACLVIACCWASRPIFAMHASAALRVALSGMASVTGFIFIWVGSANVGIFCIALLAVWA